ncbi:MAG: hypothetical protein K0U34_06745 [Alphaproteobacteria bacterium]|nr:hypothetical protein [Alphaproteobacteria bacterium]
MARSDEKVLMALRAKARRSIQCVFAALALGSLGFAVFAHHSAGFAELDQAARHDLANAFLFLGTANALTMWAWDLLFWHDVEI